MPLEFPFFIEVPIDDLFTAKSQRDVGNPSEKVHVAANNVWKITSRNHKHLTCCSRFAIVFPLFHIRVEVFSPSRGLMMEKSAKDPAVLQIDSPETCQLLPCFIQAYTVLGT